MSLTNLLDTPFFTGSGGLSNQVPYPWPIAIDGHPFAIDLAHYAWDMPDMMRQSFDSSDRPGEGTFETHGVWRRIYSDWSLGAGQVYADPSTSDKNATRQFTSSLGVDCWTPRQLSLLPQVEEYEAQPGITPLIVFPLGNHLYMLMGSVLFRTADPQSSSPTYEFALPAVAGISDVTDDGSTVYFATISGIQSVDTTSSSLAVAPMGADAATYNANIIQVANGFLLAGSGGELASFSAAGTKTTITTRPTAGFAWTAIVGAPNAIYAGGQASDLSCIYSIALDTNTGGLGAAVYAGELARGEHLTALSYYGQFILIGTTKGFHVAEIGTGNQLAIGPLIPTPNPVHCFYADANYIWFGWSGYDTTHTGVGRANLGEFSSALLPAYASDLMAHTTGTVTSVARFGDRTYFTIDSAGFYRQEQGGSLEPTATIRLGRLEWGTMAAKTFLGAEIITEPLEGTFSATLEDETGRQAGIGGRTIQSTTGRGSLLGAGLGTNSNFYDVILDFARGTDPTTGPVLRAVTARALPMPTASQTWTLAIICTDKVTPAENTEFSQDPNEIQAFLLDLRVTGRPVTFQEGAHRHLVVVRSVSFPDGTTTRWSEGRRTQQGTLLVTLASAEGS